VKNDVCTSSDGIFRRSLPKGTIQQNRFWGLSLKGVSEVRPGCQVPGDPFLEFPVAKEPDTLSLTVENDRKWSLSGTQPRTGEKEDRRVGVDPGTARTSGRNRLSRELFKVTNHIALSAFQKKGRGQEAKEILVFTVAISIKTDKQIGKAVFQNAKTR
jgi:hypothetical protein